MDWTIPWALYQPNPSVPHLEPDPRPPIPHNSASHLIINYKDIELSPKVLLRGPANLPDWVQLSSAQKIWGHVVH